jgi:uncharacterized LabA/DUF88 family protein
MVFGQCRALYSKMKAVIFIDGNNFYHNLKQMKIKPSNLNFEKFTKMICNHFNCEIKEVRYYNSIPTIRDGKDVYFSHLKFIDDLRKLPRFKIFTRKLQVHSTKELLKEKQELIDSMDLCDSCKPIVEENLLGVIGNVKKKEKGVDIMIAVDISESAISKNADVLILVSGDADFIPALELARKNNVQVKSVSLAKGYSRQLRDNFEFLIVGRNKIVSELLK